MKLADVFVVVNGHVLGPFVTVLPQDARGYDIVPSDGDEIQVLISPRATLGQRTAARATLRKT